MALGQKESNTYIKTFQKWFTVKVDEKSTGAVKRENKSGNTVYEKRYDFVEGYITDVKYVSREDSNTGKTYHNMNVHLTDGSDSYVIVFGKKSNAANAVMQTLPNVDLEKKVRFELKYDSVDEKTTLFVKQNGAVVKWKWTKDNPGKKPAWKAVVIDGETKYDRTDEFNFFETVLEYLRPKMKQVEKSEMPITDEPFDVDTEDDDFSDFRGSQENSASLQDSSFPTQEPAMAEEDDLPF